MRKERLRLVSKRFFQFLGSMVGFTLLLLAVEACWHGIQFHYGWRQAFSDSDRFVMDAAFLLASWVAMWFLIYWAWWAFQKPVCTREN